jgi:small GTP-binding protein
MDLSSASGQLPTSLKPLKDILDLVLDQYKPVFTTKRSIAVVGPANVGKSTLYNHLISAKEDVAEVGPVPGTTRQNQEADTGLFLVVDTPGADAVGAVGQREREIAFQAARQADFLVIVFEATRGIKRYEKDLFDDLAEMGKPFLVVLNKMDLVPKGSREEVVASAAKNLALEPAQIIPTVATKGTNVGRVLLAIVRFEPGLLAAVAEALPEYRGKLAWQRIVPAASSAGAIGWIPLPFADLAPLFLIQSGMVLSIARVYGYKITPGRARELLATFGLGFVGRAAYQQLSKLLGVPGWILSAAVAASTTVAIGYAAMMWFSMGEKPSAEALRQMTTDVAGHLRQRLSGLGKKRPGKTPIRERIRQALEEMPNPLAREDKTPPAEIELDLEPIPPGNDS